MPGPPSAYPRLSGDGELVLAGWKVKVLTYSFGGSYDPGPMFASLLGSWVMSGLPLLLLMFGA